MLKCGQCVAKSKQHRLILKEPMFSDEGGFFTVALIALDLIISGIQLQGTKPLTALDGVEISDKLATLPIATPVLTVIMVLRTSLRSRGKGSYCRGTVGYRNGDTSSPRIGKWVGKQWFG